MTADPTPRCIACSKPVRPIEGRIMMKGKTAAFRHVKPPIGCRLGDPLTEDQVTAQ